MLMTQCSNSTSGRLQSSSSSIIPLITYRFSHHLIFSSMISKNSTNSRRLYTLRNPGINLSFEQFLKIFLEGNDSSSVSMSSMRKSYKDYLKWKELGHTSLLEKFLRMSVKGSGMKSVIMSEIVSSSGP